ncbi:hypothetical protein ABL78_0319 [Leptomonas seymouri]|uniref:HMG box domain-containing protein n=1 Tax=Leptomonas seymouri TaxID=5684 RepID=A0A0N0P908_LEPSE|nr:hypothetical protein ABL78_0319 [Leptomonas seymouri]|eukprot:KPI90559.1 hypothetical protein ABL78_0319 [Leptomonas seymouri]
MYRLTILQCAAKKKVFELFCREQLLVNYSLRELSPAGRRAVMTEMFKELPEETVQDLKQRATIEESRLEALKRAAAAFKPVTPYEFFVKEQWNNPALCSSANPRDREVRLLQVYESLPDKAKEALAARAERFNAEHSKLPEAPPLPVIPVIKKKAVPVKSKKKTRKKKKKQLTSSSATKPKKAETTNAAEEQTDKKTAKVMNRPRRPLSPYSIFVKEQMASVQLLAPKERMRVIGERWRSLTNEERERRLAAARMKIASETVPETETETAGEASKQEGSAAASPVTSSPVPVAATEPSVMTSASSSPPGSPPQSSNADSEQVAASSSSPAPTEAIAGAASSATSRPPNSTFRSTPPA